MASTRGTGYSGWRNICSLVASVGIVIMLVLFALFMVALPLISIADGTIPQGRLQVKLIDEAGR